MANYAEELRKNTEALQKNTEKNAQPRDELGRFTSAGGGSAAGGAGNLAGLVGGVMGKGGGFLAAGGPAGVALAAGSMAFDAASDLARFATPAAKAFAATGSSAAFAAGVTQSLLNSVEGTGIGGLVLGATGVSQARNTAQRAGDVVKGYTEEMARAGLDVPDKLRNDLVKTATTQEARVATERAKVDALVSSADALKGLKPEGAGAGFDQVVDLLAKIERWLAGFTGGGR